MLATPGDIQTLSVTMLGCANNLILWAERLGRLLRIVTMVGSAVGRA